MDEPAAAPATPRTLCIDIGGTGLKALIVGPEGKPLTDRVRVETPRPATPSAVLRALERLVSPLGEYERISVGFPGVCLDGVTKTAHNLHPRWLGFPLARQLSRALGRPARVINDAGVQGFGVVKGKGVEMALTFGTGMGCALFIDGRYVPNIELAHHPFRNGKTYEEYIGKGALEKVGKKKWNRRVARVIAQVEPIFNPRFLYLGGGNAKHIKVSLPSHVKIVSNEAGLLGGIALWNEPGGAPGER
ncbi:MAG TPA: ROK family protein [Myxococcaceae bacterium]|jgi:polyphosphate glucokinase|nr:ROK family protein [Myxococcaceae bacterium]